MKLAAVPVKNWQEHFTLSQRELIENVYLIVAGYDHSPTERATNYVLLKDGVGMVDAELGARIADIESDDSLLTECSGVIDWHDPLHTSDELPEDLVDRAMREQLAQFIPALRAA